MSPGWVGFICGLFLGAPVGMVALALCVAAKRGDKDIERMFSDVVPGGCTHKKETAVGTRKSMIIIGAAGSGKTRRATEEAEKGGGNYGVTFWDEIWKLGRASVRPFVLGRALGSCPQTLIVEGLPFDIFKDPAAVAFLKYLTRSTVILIEEKHKEPRHVPAPMFIFTMLTETKPPEWLESGLHFEIIKL